MYKNNKPEHKVHNREHEVGHKPEHQNDHEAVPTHATPKGNPRIDPLWKRIADSGWGNVRIEELKTKFLHQKELLKNAIFKKGKIPFPKPKKVTFR